MKFYLITIILTIITLSGCTNRDIYGVVQQTQESKCKRLLESEYDDCMANMKESYESYTEKRREAIESEK